jgi:hypothetical protein
MAAASPSSYTSKDGANASTARVIDFAAAEARQAAQPQSPRVEPLQPLPAPIPALMPKPVVEGIRPATLLAVIMIGAAMWAGLITAAIALLNLIF